MSRGGVKEKLTLSLVKMLRYYCAQDYCDRHRDYFSGALRYGRETWLSCEYNKEKWEFIAKEQGRGGDGKLLRKL